MRILLAIDDSPSSKSAVDEVCRRPWPFGTEVRIVSVPSRIEMMVLRENAGQLVSSDEVFKVPGWDSVKFVKDAATELNRRAPDLRVTPVLLGGRRPQEVILDEAKRWGADLIVVGSHGYGLFRRFLFGSVSSAVALNATCSVEIVRRLPNQISKKWSHHIW